MSAAPWLLADVGGTNIRFALTGQDAAGQDAGRLIMPLRFACADYSGLAEAIIAYLRPTGARPDGACFAVAGPVIGDRVSLTNSAWSFSIADTARRFGLTPLLVVNDFQALAHALPLLGPNDVAAIGPPMTVERAAKAALGPGTGFGVAGLVPDGAHWVAVTSEGGHMSFAPSDEHEEAVIAYLRPRFGGRVSLDRLLSGSGLVAIFEALSALAGQNAVPPGAAEIAARGLAGSCPTSLARSNSSARRSARLPAISRSSSLRWAVSISAAASRRVCRRFLPTGPSAGVSRPRVAKLPWSPASRAASSRAKPRRSMARRRSWRTTGADDGSAWNRTCYRIQPAVQAR
jgi:glucokinase